MDPENSNHASTTLTVEMENQRNLHDELVNNALDAVLKNTEQSYPQFMENFTQLSNESVTIPNLNLHCRESQEFDDDFPTPDLPDSSTSPSSHTSVNHGSNTLHRNTLQSTSDQDNQEDTLEEEILSVGDRPPSVLLRESSYTGNSVKLDNFIDGNDSDSNDSVPLEEGEWIELGGYQASFSPRSLVNQETSEGKTDIPLLKRDSTGAIVIDEPAESQSESSRPVSAEPAIDLFPGEIEDVPVSPRETDIRNVRQLDISTTTTNKGNNSKQDSFESQVKQESCGDEVQPFQLDDAFDYDNVVLSSKFNLAISSISVTAE